MLNIDIWDILWTIVNLLILFLLLRRFLFKPVTAIMDKRTQLVREELDAAKQSMDEADSLKEKYASELGEAQKEAVRITAAAKKRADKESAEIIAQAKNDASDIITEAHKSVERERREAVDAAKEQIASLAVMAAAQVLAKNIDENDNLELAQQLLSEVGADNG